MLNSTDITEFRVKDGELTFHSDAYEWLIVAGTKAIFKGVGTINGRGPFEFVLSAIDGDPAKTEDTFHVRIWAEDGTGHEVEVFDNEMGDVIDVDAASRQVGRLVSIHKA